MNLKKNFLLLSIKHQISFVISIISILSLLLILALFSLYGNIIMSIRKRAREEYFNERYKYCFDSLIDFQNFLLYQYEQLLKEFNEQIYYFSISVKDFDESFFDSRDIPVKIYDYDESFNNMTSLDEYYKLYFSKDKSVCENDYDFTRNYIFLYNHINTIKNLRVLYLGIDGETQFILKDYLFVSMLCKNLLTNNKTKIKDIIDESNNNFDEYFENKSEKQIEKIQELLEDYKNGKLPLIDVLFPNNFDIFENYSNLNITADKKNYLNNISHFFTYIDYRSENTFYSDNKTRFIQQYSFFPNYLNEIFIKIQNFVNLNTIPVYKENNTIFSKDLCFAFLYKQFVLLNLSSDEYISEEQMKNIYNKLKVGESTIDDCILGKRYNIDIKQNVDSFLENKYFDKYYSLINKRDTFLFKLSDTPLGERFFGTKYTFPEYSSILDFNPPFFTIEQLNLYSFMSFHEVTGYINTMQNFFGICQYMMVIFLIYLWFIIYIYLRIRLEKLYGEVIQPINDLNDKISQLDIKEENQLKYEADDSINELFKLCNELLLGKYKKKLMHESELELEKMEKEKNYNLNNLKIDRKIIEEMIENKDQYNNVENDIFVYKTLQENSKINIKAFSRERERKKLNTVIDKPENNNIYNNNKDLFDLNYDPQNPQNHNEKVNLMYKKMSANEAFIFEGLRQSNSNINNSNKNENDDNILEMKAALNYKSLFEIVDFVFYYDIESDRDFIPKKNKLLYKQNLKNYNKLKKGRSRKISSVHTKEDNKSENVEKNSTINEIKDDGIVKIEDFDRSVVDAYNTKNLLFIWYQEAKYFRSVDFLQKDHDKELKDLCKIALNNGDEKNKLNRNVSNKKKNKLKTLRKVPSINTGFDNLLRKSNIKP